MMMRTGTTLMTLVAVLAAAPAVAAEMTKHSGTISGIDPSANTLTLQELGPWTGPGTPLVARTFRLEPGTTVELVQRSSKPAAAGWPGGYVETPLALNQLRPGDFATVTVAGRGNTAAVIDVVRPSRG